MAAPRCSEGLKDEGLNSSEPACSGTAGLGRRKEQEETRVCFVSVRSNRISDLRDKKPKGSKKPKTSQDFLCLGAWMNNNIGRRTTKQQHLVPKTSTSWCDKSS